MRCPRVPSALWLAAYTACVLLVMSFIAFEVLDFDGSDFASPVRTASMSTSTDAPPDLRRVPLPATLAIPLIPDVHADAVRLKHDDDRAYTPPHPSLRHSSRTTLARGLLADPLLTA